MPVEIISLICLFFVCLIVHVKDPPKCFTIYISMQMNQWVICSLEIILLNTILQYACIESRYTECQTWHWKLELIISSFFESPWYFPSVKSVNTFNPFTHSSHQSEQLYTYCKLTDLDGIAAYHSLQWTVLENTTGGTHRSKRL